MRTEMERQQYMLNFMLDICDRSFAFKSFEEVRDAFKNLINLVTQMNFSAFNDEAFQSYEKQVQQAIKENTESHETESIS